MTADGLADLLTKGPLNKAIKHALLYNYFGFPVANIKDSFGIHNHHMGSLQFQSENRFHLKNIDFSCCQKELNF